MSDAPPTPPSSTPPYRTPWQAAEKATHPDKFRSAGELQAHIRDLRREVDAGKHDKRLAPELADRIAELADGREWLRRYVRPRRAVYLYVVTLLGAWGAVSAVAGLVNALYLAPLVVLLVASSALNVARLAQWADIIPEYDGLIGDLRKLAEARRKEGPSIAGAISDEELLRQLTEHQLRQHELDENIQATTEKLREITTRQNMIERAVEVAKRRVVEPHVRVAPEGEGPSGLPGDTEEDPVQTPAEEKRRVEP